MPEIGESLVWGRLRSMGLQVTRERVRQAIRRTDPLNTALRWRDLVSRRPYSVPGPNSLWHIGKLLRVCVSEDNLYYRFTLQMAITNSSVGGLLLMVVLMGLVDK